MEKSAIRFLLKKGVTKGSELGFEIEVTAVTGTTPEELSMLGDLALKEAERLAKIEVKLSGN